jgi:hypothetical protein
MDQPEPRPRTAEEWKAYGKRMAAAKAQHRREMGPSIEVFPVISVPGCSLALLLWPLLAVLWLLGLNTTD